MVHATTILRNARLLGRQGLWSVALLGERILAIAPEDELTALGGPRTRVHDLGGRLLVPGFTDSHVHLIGLARRFLELDLTGADSLQEALQRVARRARRTPRGAWLTGGGFDKNRWGDRWPDRRDLDRVAPYHAVVLRSRDGHTAWLNSLALRRCGITARTQPPPGGAIPRDRQGQPTGILHEAATSLVRSSPAFQPPRVGLPEVRRALRFLLRQGITSAHVMGEEQAFCLAQDLRGQGELPVRLAVYFPLGELDAVIRAGLRSGLGDEWLLVGGVKLFVDGALGSQTAWMFRPYHRPLTREPGRKPRPSCGVPVLRGRELRAIVLRAHEAGLACALHAIGDRANAEALDALAWARARTSRDRPPALPDRVEHAQLLRPEDIPRFSQLGIVASMQPCHLLGDIPVAEQYWGSRSRWAYPIASLLRAGATVAFGSDAPVETSDPLKGIYAAVTRQMLNGEPRGGWYRREEGISVRAAIQAYTRGPALATAEGDRKGTLSPGYLADLVVLSVRPSHHGIRELWQSRPEMVFVGGRLRYRRP